MLTDLFSSNIGRRLYVCVFVCFWNNRLVLVWCRARVFWKWRRRSARNPTTQCGTTCLRTSARCRCSCSTPAFTTISMLSFVSCTRPSWPASAGTPRTAKVSRQFRRRFLFSFFDSLFGILCASFYVLHSCLLFVFQCVFLLVLIIFVICYYSLAVPVEDQSIFVTSL